jgi:hypothetical protein
MIEAIKKGDVSVYLIPGIIIPRTPDSIHEYVCKYFNVDPELPKQRTRKTEVSKYRMICMFLMFSFDIAPLTGIAKFYNKRQHQTVISAAATVKNWYYTDKELRQDLNLLTYELKKGLDLELHPERDFIKEYQNEKHEFKIK